MQFQHLSDEELTATVKRLATEERTATATLVRSLMEVDDRRLYLRAGCSSLFTWCTQVIGLAEGAAYHRIDIARAARRVPQLIEGLEDGTLTLATARVLAPHVTPENGAELIGQARHKSRREVEQILAACHPLPDIPCTVNYLSPGRVRVHLTISEATHDKLRRATELLRHANPSGSMSEVLDRALTLLIAHLERRKFATAASPRARADGPSTTRHIPAEVQRAVHERDGGQCAFIGSQGRCTEKGLLEYHHRQPYAAGGASTVDNIELRCRSHNQYEAEVYFGENGADVVREVAPDYLTPESAALQT